MNSASGDVNSNEQALRKAADAGDMEAMSSLGELSYEQGDYKEAKHWFRKAADLGHGEALKALNYLNDERNG
ncbi:MAG: sel1 repeat family protein [Actinomycetales bacterium]|nr:sel1 repeat family protein [Actinomycetales bacterium]